MTILVIRKANCWNNATTESLWGSLKRATVYCRRFQTQAAVKEVARNRWRFRMKTTALKLG
jgi:hypothetical protein